MIMKRFNERCKDSATDGTADGSSDRAFKLLSCALLRSGRVRFAISLGEERRVHFAPAAVAVVSACCKTIKVKIVSRSVAASVLFCADRRVCYIELVVEVYLIKWD